MAVHIRPRKNDFETPPTGNQIAVCSAFIYLGFQERHPKAKEGPPQEKIALRFEFPKHRLKYRDRNTGEDKEGPMILWTQYTLSLFQQSHLAKLVKNWMGKEFKTIADEMGYDFTEMLGQAGLVNVVQNGDYTNIGDVTPLLQGMPVPKAELPLLLYDDDNMRSMPDLPPWIQEKIEKQVNPEDWQKSTPLTGNSMVDADTEPGF